MTFPHKRHPPIITNAHINYAWGWRMMILPRLSARSILFPRRIQPERIGPFSSRAATRSDSTLPDAEVALASTDTRKHVALLPQALRSSHVLIMLGLMLVALVPRLILALQLDLVTDEVVYIQAGKTYLPLLFQLNIGAGNWVTNNYEHPPLVKLLIGLFVWANGLLGQPLSELLAARLPSVLMGTVLVLALYRLARAPFGTVVALGAALSLAVSPWLSYFSALAYLDMTMTAFITIAYLLVWHAIHRPQLYLLVAVLVGCGAASKYTAVLSVPAMVLFTAYYFFLLRPRLPAEQQPLIPWRWWLAAIVLAPLALLVCDPAIWPSPFDRLQHSFTYEWNHSIHGHLTFLAGHYETHVPQWAIVYIVGAKISAFVTIPAALFVLFALVQLVRFHLRTIQIGGTEVAGMAFAAIWLIATLGMFSLLNIVVGTHYHLPLAAPVALCGACGLAQLLRYRRGALFKTSSAMRDRDGEVELASSGATRRLHPRAVVLCVVLLLALTTSHVIGLLTIPEAEGYTSELFQGENTAIQVAYPGYREALQWLAENHPQQASVGLAAIQGTLKIGNLNSSWYAYNIEFTRQFQLTEIGLDETNNKLLPSLESYDYIIWPMHLVQRGFSLPSGWRDHVIHTISGGETTYCFILARPPTSSTGRTG